jgi:hypothetical protein
MVWRALMTRADAVDTKQLLSEALRLSVHERVAVMDALMKSLEGPIDPDADSGWLGDTRARVDDVDPTLAPISWSEAFRRIHQAAARRDAG